MKNAVTLFSGIGSSSLALRNLGYDVIPHDFMPEAVQTLRANGFDLAQQVDVRDIDYTRHFYNDTDVLVGGPPCQPFSQAHDGDGEYDPRDMIPEFIRAVRDLRPRLFVMEEVKTLTWKKHRAYLDRVVTDLQDLGYHVQWKVLDASSYTGQARKRLFVVGRAGGWAVQWPAQDGRKITMAEALGWSVAEPWKRNQQAPEPARLTAGQVMQGMLDWVHLQPAPTVVGSFRPDVAAKPGWRKPGDGPRQNTPGSVVTTFEERLTLQGLPTNWVVCGSQAKRDLQVGNSVPTPLIQALIAANNNTL